MPMTASTRDTISWGTLRLNQPTMAAQADSNQPHNSREPSCPPQIADRRYPSGNAELL